MVGRIDQESLPVTQVEPASQEWGMVPRIELLVLEKMAGTGGYAEL